MKNLKINLIAILIVLISTYGYSQCPFEIRAWDGSSFVDIEGCEGTDITLIIVPDATNNECDGDLTFIWSSGEETAQITKTIVAGNLNFSVTISNDSNNDSMESVEIEMFENPTVSIEASDGSTGNQFSCVNGTDFMLFGNAVGGAGGYSHTWTSDDPGDVIVETGGPNTMVTAVSLGSANIEYKVTDSKGCMASEEINFSVVPNPTANIAGPSSSCIDGGSITLSGNPSGGSGGYSNFIWSSNNSNVTVMGNGESAILSNTNGSSGSATITFSFEDDSGCAGTADFVFTYFDNPTANIQPDPNSDCSTGSVNLFGNVNGSDPFMNQVWTSSDPSVAAVSGLGNNATLTLVSDGMTTITFSFEDSNGCNGSDTFEFNFAGFPNADIEGPVETCLGTTVDFSGTVIGGSPYYGYTWTSSDESVLTVTTGNQNSTLTPVSPGIGTVEFLVTDSNGCSDVESISFMVNPSPTSNAGEDHVICLGASAILGEVASGGVGPYSYEWSDDSSSSTTTVTPTMSGNNGFTVTVTDGNGCTDSDEAIVEVFEIPDVNITGSTSVCSGEMACVASNLIGGPGNISYSWEMNDGNVWIPVPDSAIVDGNNLKIVLNNTLEFRVIVSFSDNSGYEFPGCGSTTSEPFEVIVVPTPVPVINALSSSHCPGGTSLFFNGNKRPGSVNIWNIGGAPSVDTFMKDGVLFIEWPETASGGYFLELEEKVGANCADTVSTTINVNGTSPPGLAEIFLNQTNNYLVYNDSTACQYQWGYYNPDANSGAGELVNDMPNNTFQSFGPVDINDGKTYFCQVWGGNCPELGCSTTAVFRETDSGNEPPIDEDKKFVLFPNPNEGLFRLEANQLFPNAEHQILIYNSFGQRAYFVNTQTIDDKLSVDIETADKTPGVYHLVLNFKGDLLQVESFIIQPF